MNNQDLKPWSTLTYRVKETSFRKVAGYSSAIRNLTICAIFRIRYSLLETHLGLP